MKGRLLCLGGSLLSLTTAWQSSLQKQRAYALKSTTTQAQQDMHLPSTCRFTILGGGSFGLAMATVLARADIPTTLLVREESDAISINSFHRHPSYLPDLALPESIFATTEAKTALAQATHIIHAVPVQFSREFLKKNRKFIPPNTPILSVSKGIENKSGMLYVGVFFFFSTIVMFRFLLAFFTDSLLIIPMSSMCELLEEVLGEQRLSFAHVIIPRLFEQPCNPFAFSACQILRFPLGPVICARDC